MSKKLDKAISENVEPTYLKSGSLALQYSGGRITLSSPAGKLTSLGKQFYAKTGRVKAQSAYDITQTLTREKDREFLTTRNGQRRLVRRYDPVQNDFTYTKAGKQFFAASSTLTCSLDPQKCFSRRLSFDPLGSKQGPSPNACK